MCVHCTVSYDFIDDAQHTQNDLLKDTFGHWTIIDFPVNE